MHGEYLMIRLMRMSIRILVFKAMLSRPARSHPTNLHTGEGRLRTERGPNLIGYLDPNRSMPLGCRFRTPNPSNCNRTELGLDYDPFLAWFERSANSGSIRVYSATRSSSPAPVRLVAIGWIRRIVPCQDGIAIAI